MTPFRLSGNLIIVPKGLSIFNTLKALGVDFARFCYHESLPVAGNCRACLVEVTNFEKPVVACTSDLEVNQSLWPESLFTQKCKENILESLLANHPLDCPVCDQAGECDLQDQAKIFGGDRSRFFLNKRGVFDKNCDFLIKAIMTRCIHCTRCIRFNTSVTSSRLGMLLRGSSSSVGNYFFKRVESNLFGNVIDLCPVGALTARIQAFSARPWEVKFISGVDLLDGFGSTIYYQVRNNSVIKIIPKPNKVLNGNLINDNCRFFIKGTSSQLADLHFLNKKVRGRELISWFFFFKLVDKFIHRRKKHICLLLTETLHLQAVDFAKALQNKFRKQIKIMITPKWSITKNLYEHKPNALPFLKTSAIFFFSTDLKVESAILNFKLISTYKKTLLSLFTLGRSVKKIITPFCGLSIKNAINCFEAKSKSFSKLINPVFLYGRSFMQRGDVSVIHALLNQKLRTLKILQVTIFCNETGLSFLNLPRVSVKTKPKTTVFCINHGNSYSLRKLTALLSKNVFWFNSLLPKFRVYSAVPIANTLCETGIYLGKKLSVSKKVLTSPTKARNITALLSAIFQMLPGKNKSLNLLFTELIFENLTFSLLQIFPIQKRKEKIRISCLEMKSGWEL
jgi:NADH-quinone oxidoreductase subunit G